MAHSHSSSYLAMYTWQVKSIERSLENANSKKTNFIEHQKVADWLNSLGNKKEHVPPKL